MCFFFFFFTQSLSNCFIDFLKPSLTFGPHLYWKPTFPLFSLLDILAFQITFLPSFPPSLSGSSRIIFPLLLTTLHPPVPLRGGECQCDAAFTSNLVPRRKHCTSFSLSPSPLCFCCCRISVPKICKHLQRPKLTLDELFTAAANYYYYYYSAI